MKFSVAVLGCEVFRIELIQGNPTEQLAELIAGLSADSGDPEGGDEDSKEISGGQYLHAERDTTPYSSDERYAPWEDRASFGFIQPVTRLGPQGKP